ncbi:hypothetical protein [Sphingomonas sp.]|uniref:hypothetical protein n=1 Tax=Sphingomonas sp. TaxID=28214 RepID=UPI003AFF744A
MRSSMWITALKVAIVAVALPFIWLNVWAYLPYHVQGVGNFFAIPFNELGDIAWSHRFVMVIGTDLMFGWALTSIIIAMMERSMGHSWLRVLLWIVPLNFIGNIVWALYLLLYLQSFRNRILTPSPAVASSTAT